MSMLRTAAALVAALLLIVVCGVGLYFFNKYWIHRYDALIARQAAVYPFPYLFRNSPTTPRRRSSRRASVCRSRSRLTVREA